MNTSTANSLKTRTLNIAYWIAQPPTPWRIAKTIAKVGSLHVLLSKLTLMQDAAQRKASMIIEVCTSPFDQPEEKTAAAKAIAELLPSGTLKNATPRSNPFEGKIEFEISIPDKKQDYADVASNLAHSIDSLIILDKDFDPGGNRWIHTMDTIERRQFEFHPHGESKPAIWISLAELCRIRNEWQNAIAARPDEFQLPNGILYFRCTGCCEYGLEPGCSNVRNHIKTRLAKCSCCSAMWFKHISGRCEWERIVAGRFKKLIPIHGVTRI